MAYTIRPAEIIGSDERLDKILKKLKTGPRTFIVIDKGKYKGIITDRTLRTLQHNPDMKAGVAAWNAPTLTRDMPIEEVAKRFAHGYRDLPVCDDSKVIGVLRHTDLLKELLNEGRIPPLRVSEIMSAPLISIDVKTSVAQASALMRKNNIHHLSVMENGKFLGIISTADVAPLTEKTFDKVPFVREKLGANTIEVKTVLPSVPKVYTISETARLAEAVKIIIENDIFSLVVFNKEPLGLVHSVDIIRASVSEAQPFIEIVGLEDEDKEYRDAVRAELAKLVQRVERSIPIETAKLTIKKHRKSGISRSKYSLRFVITGKRRITVDAFAWDLFKALHYIKEEVEKIAKGEKERLQGKKTPFLKRLSAAIQLGDLFPGKPEK